MEERLINLESKLSFAEDMLEVLNHTVFRQQQQIDQLQQHVRLLYQQIQNNNAENNAAEKRDARDEIPPHY
jgi:SlyX protein